MKIALNIAAVGARRGGAEKYAGILARWLAAEGHQVHVFAGEVDSGELPPGVEFHRIRPRSGGGLGWLRAYRFAADSERALARHDLDLVVGFAHVWRQDVFLAVGGSHRATLQAGLARFRLRWKRLLSWTGKAINPKHWIYRHIERKQFGPGRSPYVIAPSRFVAEHFGRWHGVPEDRIAVIPNGIEAASETRADEGARERFRRGHGLGAGDVAALFAARNYSLKGLEPLLEAFARVTRAEPKAKLVVCGNRRDGRYRRQARRLGLQEQVRFLGFVDDVDDCFRGSDFFVLPSFYDPCSLVVLEAMAAGLPVITTRPNGASELVSEGVDGFVIDSPWALTRLAAQMERLVVDEGLRAYMGRQARLRAPQLTVDARREQLLETLARAQSHVQKGRWRRIAA